jgi:hypothetical protein
VSALAHRPRVDIPQRRTAHRAPYEVTLELRSSRARITLIGALDGSSADAIGGMIMCSGSIGEPIELIGDRVTSVEPSCLDLLIAAARERLQHGQTQVLVTSVSDSFADALRRAGLPALAPVSLSTASSSTSQQENVRYEKEQLL